MRKFMIYFYFILSFIAIFMLGAYTDATIRFNEIIPFHKWILTTVFGMLFLAYGFKTLKEHIKEEDD